MVGIGAWLHGQASSGSPAAPQRKPKASHVTDSLPMATCALSAEDADCQLLASLYANFSTVQGAFRAMGGEKASAERYACIDATKLRAALRRFSIEVDRIEFGRLLRM